MVSLSKFPFHAERQARRTDSPKGRSSVLRTRSRKTERQKGSKLPYNNSRVKRTLNKWKEQQREGETTHYQAEMWTDGSINAIFTKQFPVSINTKTESVQNTGPQIFTVDEEDIRPEKRTIMVKKGGNPRLHHIQKTPASLSTLGQWNIWKSEPYSGQAYFCTFMKPIANASWLHLSICNKIYKFANCMQTATSCATKWCVLQVGCLMQKWLHYGLTEVNICSSTNTVRHTKYQHCTSSTNAAWICRIAVTAHLSEKWTNSRSHFDHKRRSNSVQAIMAIPWRLKWKMHFEKKHSGSYEANSWKWRMSISNMKQTWLKTEQTNKQTKVNSSISKITEQELNGSKALISSHNSSEVVIRHSHFSLSRSNSH